MEAQSPHPSSVPPTLLLPPSLAVFPSPTFTLRNHPPPPLLSESCPCHSLSFFSLSLSLFLSVSLVLPRSLPLSLISDLILLLRNQRALAEAENLKRRKSSLLSLPVSPLFSSLPISVSHSKLLSHAATSYSTPACPAYCTARRSFSMTHSSHINTPDRKAEAHKNIIQQHIQSSSRIKNASHPSSFQI